MTDLRRIDALVAEHVMGKKPLTYRWGGGVQGAESWETSAEHYSTSIKAAWEVVEKMRESRMLIWIQISPGGNYRAEVHQFTHLQDVGFYERIALEEVAATAPQAICLAALKAKGVEVPE